MECEDFTKVILEAPLVLLVESLRNQMRTIQCLQDESKNMEECWGKLQVAASDQENPSSFEEITGAYASASEDFLQKYKQWMTSTEEIHKVFQKNIPGCFEKLQEQQREYEELQTELSTSQQRFNAIVENVLPSLESGDAEKRRQFLSKVTLMKQQWQNVSWVVQHRKKCIEGFVKLWHLFLCSQLSLNRFLVHTKSFITSVRNQDCHSQRQRRNLIKDLKSKAVILQRWQALYSAFIETGEKLCSVSDPETTADLQKELSQVQQSWEDTQVELEKMTVQLSNTLQLTRRSVDGSGSSSSTSGSSHQQGRAQSTSVFRRALFWALLLFPLLLLFLFFLTSVTAPYDEFERCMSVNNFARSFNLMLQYPYGPPPS